MKERKRMWRTEKQDCFIWFLSTMANDGSFHFNSGMGDMWSGQTSCTEYASL